ncbi:hypothetical protein HOY82DRAFT_555260 [Tuber indicum]|nr:hypothetical protein HOY82DRAFT_555260 [Tuber indicum]
MDPAAQTARAAAASKIVSFLPLLLLLFHQTIAPMACYSYRPYLIASANISSLLLLRKWYKLACHPSLPVYTIFAYISSSNDASPHMKQTPSIMFPFRTKP